MSIDESDSRPPYRDRIAMLPGDPPVAYRPGLHATANRLVAPVTAWDNVLSALSDWYREA